MRFFSRSRAAGAVATVFVATPMVCYAHPGHFGGHYGAMALMDMGAAGASVAAIAVVAATVLVLAFRNRIP